MRQSEACTTIATSLAGKKGYWLAAGFCLIMSLATIALIPVAPDPMAVVPGFIPMYQSALSLIYIVTTLMLFAQFVQVRSVSVLVLAAGSLFTTGIVLLQLLAFPNVVTTGLLIGQGPATLTWLWTFWHIGPPLCALIYALLEGSNRSVIVPARVTGLAGWLVAAGVLLVVVATGVLVCGYVQYLPKLVEGADYWMLTTSGVGPLVEVLTVVALVAVCWITRLRTLLQLLVAVSLFLLALDNVLTDWAAARGTIGWLAGRVEALLAAGVILGMYLAELDALLLRSQAVAAVRERERAIAESARDHLDTALGATGMGGWELDYRTGETRRTLRHDQIFGHTDMVAHWGVEQLLEAVIPEDRGMVAASFAEAWTSGRLRVECRIKRVSDGKDRWVLVEGKARYDADGRPVSMAGCVVDTTERRRTEERLREVARMESIGQLTGGVAHDFNNLLAVIIGNLEMMEASSDEPEVVSHCLDSALTAAWHGSDVIGSLLTFSRRQVMRRDVVDVNVLLRKFSPLLRQAGGGKLDLTCDLDPQVAPARLDGRQLEVALLNLIANARDAMPVGGQVTVRTRTVTCGPDDADQLNVPPGDYVSVAVTDTGLGMDRETARMAFEPFFTTKEIGKGTGLGLSQVYGFACQEGGTARIISDIGAGTTIELLLPKSAEPGVAGADASDVPFRGVALPTAAQGKVVLVVEDDPAVQTVAVGFLSSLGYKTLTADSAAAALERLRSAERIDLMFSDVVMPGGTNGVQLTQAAREIREGLRVVLTSGYTASALEQDFELPAGTPLLSKPYGRATLARTLEDILLQPVSGRSRELAAAR